MILISEPDVNQSNKAVRSLSMLGCVKHYTIGLLMLVEDGKIDLDAPVSTYVPEFKVSDAITVRHLLSHNFTPLRPVPLLPTGDARR